MTSHQEFQLTASPGKDHKQGPSAAGFRFSRGIRSSLFVLILWHVLMVFNIDSVRKAFFGLAWLTYIWFIDALVLQLSGSSLLTTHRRKLAVLLPGSLFVWLIFELYNIYLQNWKYAGLPELRLFRWLGYAFAFSTVLLAFFETARLLEILGLFKNARIRPKPDSQRWHIPYICVGTFCLLAPLVQPRIFFPLIWAGFIYLLEPLNYARGGVSLKRLWLQGNPRTHLQLIVSGVICGLLWEFWNYWAISKWIYVFPSQNWMNLFEMPIEGYIGFPFFAVECYVMMNTICLFVPDFHWHSSESTPKFQHPLRAALAGFLLLLFCFFAFHQIDRNSVASFRPFELRLRSVK